MQSESNQIRLILVKQVAVITFTFGSKAKAINFLWNIWSCEANDLPTNSQVMQSNDLKVDESSLTGESDQVKILIKRQTWKYKERDWVNQTRWKYLRVSTFCEMLVVSGKGLTLEKIFPWSRRSPFPTVLDYRRPVKNTQVPLKPIWFQDTQNTQ